MLLHINESCLNAWGNKQATAHSLAYVFENYKSGNAGPGPRIVVAPTLVDKVYTEHKKKTDRTCKHTPPNTNRVATYAVLLPKPHLVLKNDAAWSGVERRRNSKNINMIKTAFAVKPRKQNCSCSMVYKTWKGSLLAVQSRSFTWVGKRKQGLICMDRFLSHLASNVAAALPHVDQRETCFKLNR